MTKRNVIVFRVDASQQIGTGHVMRCLTLAKALRTAGKRCHFVCRAHAGNLADLIRGRDFDVTELPPGTQGFVPAADPDVVLPAHAQWLGCDWSVDAEQTADVVRSTGADTLVVDHYALDARWERRLKLECSRLMVIDDLADRTHQCDLLLDQNWFGEGETDRYRGLVPESCVVLLGPRYALLGPAYAFLRSLLPPRDGVIRRVLVFMGGSDPTNETAKVMAALSSSGLEQLLVDVVIGVNHPDADGVAGQVAQRPGTRMHCGLPSLAGWMARADLMISAGGSISWERMCLGLPGIVISIADNQTPTNRAMFDSGFVEFLGESVAVTEEAIVAAVRRCLEDPLRMQQMSRRAQELVAGNGSGLVYEQLERVMDSTP